jgi:gluconolactonase
MKGWHGIAVSLFAVLFLPLSVCGQTARGFRLEPLSPKFLLLIASDAKLETVASGFGFTEGPMWDPAGFLYVSHETLDKIFRVYPDGHREEVISLGDPDGNTSTVSIARSIVRASCEPSLR